MKLLKDILYRTRIEQVVGSTNNAMELLAFDSREVAPFCAFIAVKGTQVDGHDYIDGAIEKGALAIICEKMPEEFKEGVTYVRVANSAKALGIMAANFYDHPSQKLKLVGITGTNGKTSTATMLYDLFRSMGSRCGLISTVETRIEREIIPSTHTTPDAIRLNALLAEMVEKRCTHCFMEVSSHAVVQERITGLTFSGAVFTNITRDHLDYHGSFNEYIKAKKRFFDDLPENCFALVNADDTHSEIMLQNTKAAPRSYAIENMADHRARIIENQFGGLHMSVDGHDVYTQLIGAFNASNLLAVYSVAVTLGGSPLNVLTSLSGIKPVPGRFEIVRAGDGVTGIVDYAHTPDALKNVLGTIKEICVGGEKVITVVGCGGDRDKGKRPLMANIAVQMSNTVILTSDNPRSEDPQVIINEMKAGLDPEQKHRTFSVVDRKEAISMACNLATPGDVVLVAGKGHETYQEINGERFDFNDVAILKETLELLHS